MVATCDANGTCTIAHVLPNIWTGNSTHASGIVFGGLRLMEKLLIYYSFQT